MRRRVLASVVVVGVVLLATSTFSAGTFDKAEYAARRSRLMLQIGDGAAIFLGAQTPSSDVAFRQGHDFFYLTGVEIPDALLVVDGLRKESVLFFTMDEATADGFAIPLESEAGGQFVGDELIVGRSLKRQKSLEKLPDLGWPIRAMVAAGEVEDEGGWMLEPGGAQAKEMRPTDVQKLGGRLRVESTPIKSVERLVKKWSG